MLRVGAVGFIVSVGALLLLMGHHVSVRYIVVALPMLALVLPWPRIPTPTVPVLVVALAVITSFVTTRISWYQHQPGAGWRASDISHLVPVLAEHGNLATLGTGLQSADRRGLLTLAASALVDQPPGPEQTALQLVRVLDDTATPEGWQRIALDGRIDAIYRVITPSVSFAQVSACLDGECAPMDWYAEPVVGGFALRPERDTWLELEVPANTQLIGLASERFSGGACYPSFRTAGGDAAADWFLSPTPTRVVFTLPDGCWSLSTSPAWIETSPDDVALRYAINMRRNAMNSRRTGRREGRSDGG